MANAFSGNKGKAEIVAGTIYQSLTSPTKPTDVIPSGAAGIVADSNGLLQVVAGDGTVSPLAGESLFSATAAQTLTAGQWVYINSAGNAALAQANASTTSPAIGVVNAAAANAAACLIQTSGIFNTTGLTKGSFYWLSASAAGSITATAPSVFGQFLDPIGYALSATQLLIGPAQAATAIGYTTTVGAVLASATTIVPTNTIHHVSGTTNIVNITAPASFTGSIGGQVTLIPDGLWATTNAGNIAIASTAVVSKAMIMTYDPVATKWYPSY